MEVLISSMKTQVLAPLPFQPQQGSAEWTTEGSSRCWLLLGAVSALLQFSAWKVFYAELEKQKERRGKKPVPLETRSFRLSASQDHFLPPSNAFGCLWQIGKVQKEAGTCWGHFYGLTGLEPELLTPRPLSVHHYCHRNRHHSTVTIGQAPGLQLYMHLLIYSEQPLETIDNQQNGILNTRIEPPRAPAAPPCPPWGKAQPC